MLWRLIGFGEAAEAVNQTPRKGGGVSNKG